MKFKQTYRGGAVVVVAKNDILQDNGILRRESNDDSRLPLQIFSIPLKDAVPGSQGKGLRETVLEKDRGNVFVVLRRKKRRDQMK